MSRTFRLRRYKTKFTQKYSDGKFTLHIHEVDGCLRSILVHLILNEPCKDEGKPIIEYIKYHNQLIRITNAHSHCVHTVIHNWTVLDQLLNKLGGINRYSINSVDRHPYARPGRRRRYKYRYPKVFNHKVKRKQLNTNMRKVLITLDDSYV